MRQLVRIMLLPLAIAAPLAAGQGPPWFTGVGDLPGGMFYSSVQSISGDGRLIVGSSIYMGTQYSAPFAWTRETGIYDFDHLNQVTSGWAFDASFDGEVVVGVASFIEGPGGAFRWAYETGMIELGDLPGGDYETTIKAVSSDGRVAVGHSYSERSQLIEAVRWTPENGLEPLDEFLPGGNFYSSARDVSADGSVIVGVSDSASGKQAFRWTAEEGMIGLGDLPGGSTSSHAYAVSADGRVVAGRSSGENELSDGFRWTAETGMISLYARMIEGAHPRAVSADGAVIVGDAIYRPSQFNLNPRAFIWDAERGTRLLMHELTYYYGIHLNGWTLTSASGISDDGRTICGTGINPQGQTEGWVAYLGDPSLCQPAHDLDRDGRVTLSDLALLLANYGLTSATVEDGDFDGDGEVGISDVAAFIGDFLEAC